MYCDIITKQTYISHLKSVCFELGRELWRKMNKPIPTSPSPPASSRMKNQNSSRNVFELRECEIDPMNELKPTGNQGCENNTWNVNGVPGGELPRALGGPGVYMHSFIMLFLTAAQANSTQQLTGISIPANIFPFQPFSSCRKIYSSPYWNTLIKRKSIPPRRSVLFSIILKQIRKFLDRCVFLLTFQSLDVKEKSPNFVFLKLDNFFWWWISLIAASKNPNGNLGSLKERGDSRLFEQLSTSEEKTNPFSLGKFRLASHNIFMWQDAKVFGL